MTPFENLLEGYLSGNLGPDELSEFLSQLEANGGSLEQRIQQDLQQAQFRGLSSEALRQRLLQKIHMRKEVEAKPVRRIAAWKWMAAASVLIVLGAGIIFQLSRQEATGKTAPGQSTLVADLPPGRDGAILTLADGRQILLDTATNGMLSEAGASELVKNGNQLQVENASTDNIDVLYHTMITPKGRQFSIVLEDGTRVWLNAASSIRFPTAFTGNERRVSITGEAYLEIAKNSSKPFYVNAKELEVQVLGTSFNINAYDGEPAIKTTLMDGKVKLSNGNASAVLVPGQEGNADNAATISVGPGNPEAALAWKNGLFKFSRTDIQSVMRQVSRWYDIEVVYPNGIPADKYSGSIRRDMNLSAVFKVLEESGAHFKLEGKKVLVIP